jgi:hypothetical protein
VTSETIAEPVVSPRSSLRLEPSGGAVVARFRCEDREWRELARDAVERARDVTHAGLVAVTGVVEGDDGFDVTYAPRPGSAALTGASPEGAAFAAADVAEALAALRPTGVRCGPFVPGLVLRDAHGRGALLAAGLWHVAYRLDRGTTGRAMTMRHFLLSPDELGPAGWGAPTDVYFLAAVLFQLIARREPYPTGDEFEYMRAVKEGARVSLATARAGVPAALSALVDQCLDVAPAARPTPEDMAGRLRALGGGVAVPPSGGARGADRGAAGSAEGAGRGGGEGAGRGVAEGVGRGGAGEAERAGRGGAGEGGDSTGIAGARPAPKRPWWRLW